MIELTYSHSKSKSIDIQLPASKSISNRLLILRALSEKKYPLHNLSKANDTIIMKSLLQQKDTLYDVQDAGTVYRFMLPFLCLKKTHSTMQGAKRLMERPIQPLVDSLIMLGARISVKKSTIEIQGGCIIKNKTRINQSLSSQFTSALLLCGAAFPEGLHLQFTGKAVSEPYLELTLQALHSAGIQFERQDRSCFIPHQSIQLPECTVENDWSSASFFYQIVALNSNLKFKFNKLSLQSLQTDAISCLLFESLGVLTIQDNDSVMIQNRKVTHQNELTFHCASYPDIVPSLTVTCAALGITAHFKGISHLRDKESNRIDALCDNLTRCQVRFKEFKNAFTIYSGGIRNREIRIKTFNDHRIAMAFAPLCFINNRVLIDNIDCVKKSFPRFWTQLIKTGVNIHEQK